MTSFIEKIARAIQFHRKKAGLTRDELAQLAGVGKKAIFDIEHGKATTQLDTLLKILHPLNIQMKFESPLMEIFEKEFHEES